MKKHKGYKPIEAELIYDALERELLPSKKFMEYIWFECVYNFCGSKPVAEAYSGMRSTNLSIEKYRDMDYNEND